MTNFKSYSGHVTLGPFDRFTCIVGPNGSGKSNILDGITFAANVSLVYLRVKHAAELISNGSHGCEVKLHICNSEKTRVFSRSYDSIRQSYTYKINEKVVQSNTYTKELEKINIFSRIRSFILYQGVLHNENVNLFDTIEKISNSVMYKTEYEKLKANYLACVKLLQQKLEKKKDIVSDIYEMKYAQSKEQDFMKMLKQQEKLTEECYLLEHEVKKRDLAKIEGECKNLSEQINSVKENETYRQNMASCEALKKQVAAEYKEFYEIDMKIKCLSDGTNKEESDLDEYEKERQVLTKTIENLKEPINYGNIDRETYESELADLLNQFNEATKNEQKEDAKLTVDNYERLSRKEELEKKITKFNDRRSNLMRENKCVEETNRVKQAEVSRIEKIIADLREKATPEAINQLHKLEEELKEKEGTLNQLTKEILIHKAKFNIGKNEIFTSTVVENLKAINGGVCGKVAKLFKPTQEVYAIAISALLLEYDNTVVVDTEKTAIECINYLKQTKSCKLTFLCLNKLTNTQVPNEGYAESFINPLNCVVYENRYAAVANRIFRNKAICATDVPDTYPFNTVVTMNGSLYHRSGLITGGTNKTNKFEENHVDELTSTRAKVINEIKTLKNRKESYTSINMYVDKIKELEEKKKGITFAKVVDIEAAMQSEKEPLAVDEDELKNLMTLLADYEVSKQFIREKFRAKEKKILHPHLSKIGISTYEEYKQILRDTEKRDDLNIKLSGVNTKIAEIRNQLKSITDLDDKYRVIFNLNRQLVEAQNKLEQKKQLLRQTQTMTNEFTDRINDLNKCMMNLTLSRTKLEEEIKELISYCILETNLQNENEMAIEFVKIVNGDMNLINQLNRTKDEKARVNRELKETMPVGVIQNDTLQAKLLKFEREYEFAKESASQAKAHFNEIAVLRKKLFDQYFERLQRQINTTYNKLAYSTEEETEIVEVAKVVLEGDPFTSKHAIKYYLMPPDKGYTEFRELSGGEKSMAILSFIFAIQKQPPFYVLDEVDGALDRGNVQRLANYIANETNGTDGDKQFVVVSLKDYFYKNAESLIGVYKDTNKSRILTYKFT